MAEDQVEDLAEEVVLVGLLVESLDRAFPLEVASRHWLLLLHVSFCHLSRRKWRDGRREELDGRTFHI